jgi:dTMP kinase
MRQGKFITFEGGEGAGKSTQATRLSEALRTAGLTVLQTREPGGSEGAELLRELLVHGDSARWDGPTEALLHYAARRDHLVKTIWPALAEGTWVVCDRFADSTMAYQGYGHGIPIDKLLPLHSFAVGDFKPDVTLVLDLPAEEGLARAGRRNLGGTRYESMDLGFHERLREGFLKIASAEPGRCAIVDSTQPADDVARVVTAAVAERLNVSL